MLRVTPSRAPSRPSAASIALLSLTMAATTGIIVAGKHIPVWAFGGMLAVAAAAFFLLLRSESKRPTLRCWIVFAAAAVLMTIAVAVPPRTSNDVWAYSIYGRIVVAHHTSPYVHAPEEFPTDPYLPPAKRGYHNIRSVYGPVFTGVSAGVMKIAGTHKTVARILFQLLAALGVLGALALLWRRTKDSSALVFAGLNPIVAASIVNGGHNDALVGLAVIGGAYAAPAHPIVAGLVLGAGASVKIVGLLPLGAVALWSLYRRGVRHAAILSASGLGVVVGGYALAGGLTALGPLGRGSRLVVRHSFWYFPRQWIASSLQATGITRPEALAKTAHTIAWMSMALVLTLALAMVLAQFRKQRPERLAGASLVPYLFGASYVLPWYPGWVLPSLATSRTTMLARLVAVESILLFAVDPDRFFHVHHGSGAVVHVFQRGLLPLFEIVVVVAFMVAGIVSLWRRRPPRDHDPVIRLDEPARDEDRPTSATRG
ncbi:MAG: glycosyltransferase 87 family protein [Actinomycetota bacterium]